MVDRHINKALTMLSLIRASIGTSLSGHHLVT